MLEQFINTEFVGGYNDNHLLNSNNVLSRTSFTIMGTSASFYRSELQTLIVLSECEADNSILSETMR